MSDHKFIWSCYITDHEVVPYCRLPNNKVAQRLNERVQRYFNSREALAWMLKTIWRRKPIEQDCIVRIEVGITNNRKSDWDNFAKSVCDSMVVAQVVKDDRYIQRGECTVFRGLTYPFVGIAVYEGGAKPWIAKTNPTRINASPNAGTVRSGNQTALSTNGRLIPVGTVRTEYVTKLK